MPVFIYKATDLSGRAVEGEITVADKKKVMDFLSSKQLILVNVSLKKEKKKKILSSFFSFSASKIDTSDKARLCERLSVLIEAGVNIKEALEILAQDEKKPAMKSFLSELKTNLEKGRPFYVTFESYKNDFPPAFIGSIKTGETSGNLVKILKQLAVNLKKEQELKKKITAASIYPSILLITAVVIVTVLLVFLFPRLAANFTEAGVEMPPLTKILMAISVFFQNYYLLFFGTIAGFVIFVNVYKRTDKGKLFFAKLIDSIPIVGDLNRKLILTRFCQTLSMVLSSGISLIEGLNITSDAVGSEIYKKIILKSQERVQKGMQFSLSLKEHPKYFPHLLTGTMIVSEESGKLDEMLKPLGTFYEEEVDSALTSLVAILEPALLISLGVVVAFIALAILLPMYQMLGAV